MSDHDAPADFAEVLNRGLDGWNRAMALRFVRASGDEVIAELVIDAQHRQPYGIVHGGVYAGVIETVASVGAALDAQRRGQSVVGLENHTSFLHAAREGRLTITARPMTRGRRTQAWEGTITDDDGRVMATGRVRLLALEAGAAVAGETVKVKSSSP
jgi:uncharacterized protein (TIGR00369 family)